jgi:cyanophycinase
VRFRLAAAVVLAAASPAFCAERLVLVGGGERPREAMARFVDWAGGQVGSRILLAVWGEAEGKEGFEACRADLMAFRPEFLEAAPPLPLTAAGRTTLVGQLGRATGIFIGGARPGRIMDVLRDPELLALVRARYRAGVVLGGTSGGMAVLAERLIADEKDVTTLDGSRLDLRPGLGLFGGAVVDPHFVAQKRANRLFGLVLAHPEERGIGVDEGAGLLIDGGATAEVVGPGVVVLVDPGEDPGTLRVTLRRAGQSFPIARPR